MTAARKAHFQRMGFPHRSLCSVTKSVSMLTNDATQVTCARCQRMLTRRILNTLAATFPSTLVGGTPTVNMNTASAPLTGLVVDIIAGERVVRPAAPDLLTLDGMHRAVDGYIEVVCRVPSAARPDTFIIVVVDEEGMHKHKPLTFLVMAPDGKLLGPFVGNARIIAEQGGDALPLLPSEVEEILPLAHGLAVDADSIEEPSPITLFQIAPLNPAVRRSIPTPQFPSSTRGGMVS